MHNVPCGRWVGGRIGLDVRAEHSGDSWAFGSALEPCSFKCPVTFFRVARMKKRFISLSANILYFMQRVDLDLCWTEAGPEDEVLCPLCPVSIFPGSRVADRIRSRTSAYEKRPEDLAHFPTAFPISHCDSTLHNSCRSQCCRSGGQRPSWSPSSRRHSRRCRAGGFSTVGPAHFPGIHLGCSSGALGSLQHTLHWSQCRMAWAQSLPVCSSPPTPVLIFFIQTKQREFPPLLDSNSRDGGCSVHLTDSLSHSSPFLPAQELVSLKIEFEEMKKVRVRV